MQATKKVVIIGDSGVGKTAIMNRYLFDKFDSESMPTLGSSTKSREVEVPGEGSIKLALWDTAGQEKFKSLTRMYFQDAEAALVVYDVTFRDSFEAAKRWVEDLRSNANVPDILIAIVGNKNDMAENIVVGLEEAHAFGSQIKAEIIKEVSARDNNGVNELFLEVAKKLIKKNKLKQVRITIGVIRNFFSYNFFLLGRVSKRW